MGHVQQQSVAKRQQPDHRQGACQQPAAYKQAPAQQRRAPPAAAERCGWATAPRQARRSAVPSRSGVPPWAVLRARSSQLQDQGRQADAHPQTHNAEQGSPEGFVFGVEEVAQDMPVALFASYAMVHGPDRPRSCRCRFAKAAHVLTSVQRRESGPKTLLLCAASSNRR